jgi:hypothetical protein
MRGDSRRADAWASAWAFLPVLGAPLAHAPVLRFGLAPRLARPISRRLFGEHKTWRGALLMTGGTLAAAFALDRVPSYRRRLPAPVAAAGPLRMGLLLGTAMWLGELPNSFLKRRLGIPPGKHLHSPLGAGLAVFDMADWVPVAWLLVRPVWRMGAREGAQMFALVAVVHVPLNLLGYALGVRTSPL